MASPTMSSTANDMLIYYSRYNTNSFKDLLKVVTMEKSSSKKANTRKQVAIYIKWYIRSILLMSRRGPHVKAWFQGFRFGLKYNLVYL